MSVSKVEKKEKNVVEMTITVDAGTFGEACTRVFKRKIGTMNIPGFRKGKAPRRLVESMYGKGVFYEDAINDTYKEAFDAAVASENLEPVEMPDVNIQSVGEEGYTFTAEFHVYPQVQIGEYKGLSAVMPAAEVEEAQVDAEIDRLRERNASLVKAERPAANGDSLHFAYEGFVDDVAFAGGKDDNANLEIGSGRFIPGFEEQLIGASAGEDREVRVTFPEEYHAPELAGKEALFRCKIHEVKEKQMPVADDEFAKDVSEFDTLDAFKESLRERLRETAQKNAQQAFEDALLDQLIEGMECDIPQCMIDQRLHDILEDLDFRLRRQGMNLDVFAQMTGQSPEDLRSTYGHTAQRQVSSKLIFEEVARRENMEVTEEEIAAEVARLAEMYQRPADEVRNLIDEKAMRRDLLALKASTLVTETAQRKTPEETPASTDAAKPKAAKKSKKTAEKTDE